MGYFVGCMVQLVGLFFLFTLASISSGLAWFVFTIFVFGGIIVGFKMSSNRITELKQEIDKKMDSVNPGKGTITETKSYIAYNYESKIVLDDTNKQIGLWINIIKNVAFMSKTLSKYDFKFILMPFKDILSIEIMVDGVSVTKTSRGSQVGGALVGGLLAGGVGAIIGGTSGSKTTTEDIKQINLLITVNDIQNPIYIINFFSTDVDTVVNNINHKDAMMVCKEWYGILTHIIKADNSSEKHSSNVTIENVNISDKLKELKQLNIDGILTDDEFNEQKQKILNRL
ncbi:SHOCT domain-containing protein [Lysinibacillus sphaericus]|uniref:SHOCT domain-containing protein n=1 Tax=Lysinibacillus sphaericus TaxID=1421 RepID=UPI001A9DA4FB|nr:SHOCT domain-containing protein [Lysinibacillus sphaericus]QTB24557.1 SHOCT domain-containing protein [Lysinibacillus sphaericus]